MTAWGITDGSAGMVSQVRALLEALGMAYEMKAVRRHLAFLPNQLAFAPLWLESGELRVPWPDLVVTCGRRSAPIGAALKARHGVRAVHIHHPRMELGKFDAVVGMEHDGLHAPNVISTQFALHNITPEKLREAALVWQPRFAHLPRPWVVVLLGGSTNRYTLTPKCMDGVLSQLEQAKGRGSLLITPSRRTGAENIARLQGDYVYREGDNPYLGMLALADYIVVSDDSVNMMSEALASGKPVYLLHLPGHEGTPPKRFAEGLIREGYARPLGAPWETWSKSVPDEARRVAEKVSKLF